jgi:hypothetical protein
MKNVNGILVFDDEKVFLFLDEEFLKKSKTQIIASLEFDITKVKLDGTMNPGSLEYYSDTLITLTETVEINEIKIDKIYVNYSYFPFSEKMNNLKPNYVLKAKSYTDFANGKKVPYHPLPWN